MSPVLRLDPKNRTAHLVLDEFADAGIIVTPELLCTPLGDVPVKDIEHVSAEHRSPRLWPWLLMMAVVACGGLPLVSSWISSSGDASAPFPGLVMALLAGGLFFGIFRLMTFDSSYCVVIRRGNRARVVFRSPDHQLVISIVAAIERATNKREPTSCAVPLQSA